MPKSGISKEERQQIISLLESGWSTSSIANHIGVTTRQVAAVKAHITMRSYGMRERNEPDSLPQSRGNIDASAPTPNLVKDAQKLLEELQNNLSPVAVPIGRETIGGQNVFWDPDPNYGSANPHLMIIGESGFGKTYTIQCLVAELVKRGVPSVIIDYGRGFDLQSAPTEFTNTAVPIEVLAGEQGININPLRIHHGDVNGPLNVAVRVADSFSRVYRIGVHQHALLRDTIIEVFNDFGISKSDKSTWMRTSPTLSDVYSKLERISNARTRETSKTALSLRSHISTFFVFDTFRSGGENLKWDSIKAEKGRILIIQLKGLEGRTQQVVTDFLLWDLYHFMTGVGPSSLNLFCVLDEAHNLSFDSGTPADRLIREARKFGLGLIFASQQPEDFSDTAYANTASKLIFQTLDETRRVSRKITNKCVNCGDPSQLADLMARLPRGQAFFLTRNYGFNVKITPFNERFPAKEVQGKISH